MALRAILLCSGLILIMTEALSSDTSGISMVIAHRGASADAPENTTAAIRLAGEQGCEVIEFDVRTTSDGELFLFHDAQLKRLCAQEGIFEKLTAQQARQLDVGSWFGESFSQERPIDLKEAIALCHKYGAIPLIERKSGTPEQYAEILKKADVIDDVIVQAFDWDFLKGLRKQLPQLRIGALGSKALSKHEKHLTQLEWKPDWIGWKATDLDRRDVDWMKANGFKVATWTVNDPALAAKLISWKVDRIITDKPLMIAAKLAEDPR